MSVGVAARRARRKVLTDHWVAVIIGVVISTAATLYVFTTNGFGMGYTVFAAGAVGAFIAGAIIGKNAVEAASIGFRVGVMAGTIAAATIATGLFIAWSQGSEIYPQYSFMFFLVFFMLYTPLNGFTGALGGAVGTALRRLALPAKYNPPPY